MKTDVKKIFLLLLIAVSVGLAAPVFAGQIDVTLQIPIPGTGGKITVCSASGGALSCAGIGTYIAKIYRWLVGFAAILAVLALTWGGVQWLISHGESGKIQEARKVIGNAIIGLVLALGSYLLLAIIQPGLVTFNPLRVRSIDPLVLKLAELASTPPTSSPATRATPTVRTSLPSSSTTKPVFEAGCTLECTNRSTATGLDLEPVVTESGGMFDCNCKEKETGAICTEPDTHLGRRSDCSDIYTIGSTILGGSSYVLNIKDRFEHRDKNGVAYYCCSFVTIANPPTCGSRKDQQCCGVPGGDVVCQTGLYPVKKTTFASENKCFCYTGIEGALCNAETEQQCAPGFSCKKISGFFGIGVQREDGECKQTR